MKKLLVILLGFCFAMPAFAGTIGAVSNEVWLDHVAQMQSLRQQILGLVTKTNPTIEDRQNLDLLNLTFAERKAEWDKYLETAAQGDKSVEAVSDSEKVTCTAKTAKKPWSRYNKHARKHRKGVCTSKCEEMCKDGCKGFCKEECKGMSPEECKKTCGHKMHGKRHKNRKAHKCCGEKNCKDMSKKECKSSCKEECKGMSPEKCKKVCGDAKSCKDTSKNECMDSCKDKCESQTEKACEDKCSDTKDCK